MNILWLAWKDAKHPEAGGAERVMDELIARQLDDGHHVTLLTARYPGSIADEQRGKLRVIRVGSNRYIHPTLALLYFIRHLRGQYDVLIETVNTAPYFSLLFRGHTRGIALYHQLARGVWFFETKAPISQLGFYVIEPLATWLLGRSKAPLVTVSESTEKDLMRFGWDERSMHIISEGIRLPVVKNLEVVRKFPRPTMLGLGAIRGMKRTLDQIEAFEIAKTNTPQLQLKLAGDASGDYGAQVMRRIMQSPYMADIEYLGKVSEAEKRQLMRRSHLIAVTSVKEGWGLIVTEAASQGTPAVVYDVDGLRDSVQHAKTGLLTAPTPLALASGITRLLHDSRTYQTIRRRAWQWSKQMTFDQSYQDFKRIVEETAA
ncbi:MAG TPA: glycosyltransferase family 4 protein [Candidatus Saccharimonadales bacterium]|nr:glycosyltransferase family 4 protein [Candidatus Saccharimonadales bacterium]